jgi:hypothetical protein
LLHLGGSSVARTRIRLPISSDSAAGREREKSQGGTPYIAYSAHTAEPSRIRTCLNSSEEGSSSESYPLYEMADGGGPGQLPMIIPQRLSASITKAIPIGSSHARIVLSGGCQVHDMARTQCAPARSLRRGPLRVRGTFALRQMKPDTKS